MDRFAEELVTPTTERVEYVPAAVPASTISAPLSAAEGGAHLRREILEELARRAPPQQTMHRNLAVTITLGRGYYNTISIPELGVEGIVREMFQDGPRTRLLAEAPSGLLIEVQQTYGETLITTRQVVSNPWDCRVGRIDDCSQHRYTERVETQQASYQGESFIRQFAAMIGGPVSPRPIEE